MSGVEIVHPVPEAAAEAFARARSRTFLSDPDEPGNQVMLRNRLRDFEPERTWGARDRGRWVATLHTEARTMTVPGGPAGCPAVPIDALTGVTVAGTHRRRGLLRQMLTASLAAARERGDAISALIAAEWPIYGRFGYGPAVQNTNLRLLTRGSAGVIGAGPASLLAVEPDELAPLAPSLFAASCRERAGQLDRPARMWQRELGVAPFEAGPTHFNWVLHEGPDGHDGFLGWRALGEVSLRPPMATVEVRGPYATTRAAERGLWHYLCGLDLVEAAHIDMRPLDDPIWMLLADPRTLSVRDLHDIVWLRLLDVPAALAQRNYAVPGRLVLSVTDSAPGGYAAGRFALEIDASGAAVCAATADPPDLELDARVLASAYLGGYRLAWLERAGQPVTEVRPGALAQADLMFATPLLPWSGTWF